MAGTETGGAGIVTAAGMTAERGRERWAGWLLAVAVASTCALGVPWLFGAGVDVPDDALYYHVASWEWLRWAATHHVSPWWVPGKLGGVSLFADAMPMGPFYPAAWTVAAVPVWLAFPVACLLHGVLALLSTRWLARTLGASDMSATLAGAAVALGPLGAMGFVDCRADSWALVAWLPVALGAMERWRGSEPGPERLRWVALAGAALGAIALGSHLRLSAAALASFGLWAILGGLPLRATLPALVLGILAGAPGFVPQVLEWGQASAAAGAEGRFAFLGQPVQTGLDPSGLPGLLAPRPWVSSADYGIGAVLGLALILGIGRGGLGFRRRQGRPAPPAGRMAALALLLAAAAFSPSVPGARLLFAPLLMLSHPVNDPWLAVAALLASPAASLSLDGLVQGECQGPAVRGAIPRWVVVLLLLAGGVALAVVGPFRDGHGRLLYVQGLVQAVTVIGVALLLLLRRPARLALLVCILGLTDLGTSAVRMYTAVPSERISLRGRSDVPGVDRLGDAFVDVDDLGRLESFAYELADGGAGGEQGSAERGAGPGEGDDDSPPEFWEDTASAIQREIALRAWPAHMGMARGIRGLSGRAKLAPARQVALLMPLAEAIRSRGQDDEAIRELFLLPGSIGSRVLSLHDVRAIADPRGGVTAVAPGVPLCRSPARLERVADAETRIARLLGPDFDPLGDLALVESEDAARAPAGVAAVRCDVPGTMEVDAPAEAAVVLRERFHRGWRLTDEVGHGLEPFPVDQVHMGFRVGAGHHEIRYRFVPPGLEPAAVAAVASWLALAALAWTGWRGGLSRRSG